MRVLVVKDEKSVSAVTERIAGTAAGPSASERLAAEIRRVNPRLDFDRLKPGDVIVIPDTPDSAPDAGEPAVGSVFDPSSAHALENLKQLEKRMQQGAAQISAERTALTRLLSSAEVKRVVANQEGLAKDVERIRDSIKTDEKEAAARGKQIDATLAQVTKDLQEQSNRSR